MPLPALPAVPDTRSRLLDAAQELFHRNGYRATSLAAIAARASANPGSLYYSFKSKEELLLAVLERYSELLGPLIMDRAHAAESDPIERIFGVLDVYRQLLIETSFTVGCPIGTLSLELGDVPAEISARIRSNFELWSTTIAALLDSARDRLPQAIDRARLARFVLTVMEGAVLQARGSRRIEPFDDAVAQLRDYLDRLERDRSIASDGAAEAPRRAPGEV